MKKKLIIIITSLVVTYYALSLTGILVFSNNPTIANEPNIPLNSKTLTSNLITPKKGDFIVYNFNDEYLGNHKRVHRLVGIENDTIEIKNGIAYLNGENIDEDLNLGYFFKTNKKNYLKIEENNILLEDLVIEPIDSDNIKILLNSILAKQLNFKNERLIEDKTIIDKVIQAKYNQPWNKDNFGPIIIPEGKVFILGDNRDYTLDSRFEGYINKEDIKGVLFKVY